LVEFQLVLLDEGELLAVALLDPLLVLLLDFEVALLQNLELLLMGFVVLLQLEK
jgi:hypothetical protein